MSASTTTAAPQPAVSTASRVGAVFVILTIAGIQMLLPDTVTIGPPWLIPAIEVLGGPLVLVLVAAAGSPRHYLRWAMNAYSLFLILASATNAALLLRTLLTTVTEGGEVLLFAGFGVLIVNVLSVGLIYWQLDGGGPLGRAHSTSPPDFQFPQQASGMSWKPELADYLFTAYTNIIAFSPTDTMPLTHRVKLLFTIQSSISLVTILVTMSRAINLMS